MAAQAPLQSVLEDPERLAVLARTGLMGSPPEEAFDRLTRLVARTLRTPIALVSLVDDQRQFFKSCHGRLPEPWHSSRGTPLSHSFCRYVVASAAPLIVGDARQEPQLERSPAISQLGIIAYAAVPLRTSGGQVLGALCAIDSAPRRWREEEIGILADLAAETCSEIELKLTLARHVERDRQLRVAMRAARLSHWVWDVPSDEFCFDPPSGDAAEETRCCPIGRFYETVHPEDRAGLEAAIRSAMAAGDTFRGEYRAPAVDGEVRSYVGVASVIRDEQGRAVRFVGATRDVTDERKLCDQLAPAHDFYEVALNSVPTMIGYADADERIVYLNRAYRQWLHGWAREGMRLAEVMPPQRYALHRPYFEAALAGETVSFAEEVERNGRRHYHHRTQVPHFAADGSVCGFFTFVHDLSEARELEERLRRAQRMEAVGQLTGGVAHDFNNLLNVITGNLQLLERALDPQGRQARQLQTALRAATRGAELTRRLLAFSRQQVLNPRALDANELVEGMRELLHRTLAQAIDIRVKLAAELWPVSADSGQLENALLNLAINARDAMPDGGVLTLETSNVVLSEASAETMPGASAGEHVIVSVTDTGTGMPPEVLARAFEPFFTTKDVGKGSGLGLSMVYGFVTQSDGHVRIDSEPGAGTSVKLYFPRHHGEAQSLARRGETGVPPPEGRETILVVEDDADVRETAVAVLEALGYRVATASDGAGALALLEQRSDIDLLFSDVMMPGGMRGTELAARARQSNPRLKVLLTSGFTETSILNRKELTAEVEILPKPYRNNELAQRVRRLLDARPAG